MYSFCLRIKVAAAIMDNRPNTMRIPPEKSSSPAATIILLVLKIPRKAQLSSTPDKRADAGLGASLWASGSQVCMGASPILVPYPTRMKTNPALSHMGSRVLAAPARAEKESGVPVFAWPMEKATRTDPKRAMAIPTEQMRTYFQVASREAAERWV